MSSRTLLIVAVLIVGTVVGALFFRFPVMPHVQLPAEVVTNVGGFPITNTLLATWATMLVLIGLFAIVTRRMEAVPGRLQNLGEMVVEMFVGLSDNVAGAHRGRKFFSLVMTLFLFVLMSNWMGLLPGYGTIGIAPVTDEMKANGFVPIISWARSGETAADGTVSADSHAATATPIVEGGEATDEEHATTEGEGEHAAAEGEHGAIFTAFFRSANTDLNTTLALSIVSVIAAQYFGVRGLGFGTYFSRFFNFKEGPIGAYVGILELISEIAKFVSFSFRLFGNIFAGEVLLAVIGFLLPWVVILPFYGLELFVGVIQAFVFAMLTLVFLTMATTSHAKHDAEPGHGADHAVAEAHH